MGILELGVRYYFRVKSNAWDKGIGMKRQLRWLRLAGLALLVCSLSGTFAVAQSKPEKAAPEKTAPGEKKSVEKGQTKKDATGKDGAGKEPVGLEIVELAGKLEMIFGNQVKITTEDGKETVVTLAGDTTFKYTGTAEPMVLRPGLMIRFNAAFDALGNPQAPLTTLEIFRPAKVRRMSRELMQSQTVGIYPVSEKGNPKDKGKLKEPAAAGIQDYQVVAQLNGVQADRIQIFAGARPLMLQVDPAVKVTVAAGDAMFCQPGDDVKLTGLKNSAGLIQVETIEITGAKPIGAVDDKGNSKATRGAKAAGEKGAKPNPAVGKADAKAAVAKPK